MRRTLFSNLLPGLAVAAALGASVASSSAEGPKRVNAIIAGALNNVAMMVAAENGYWRQEGLDVRLQTLDSGSQISKALLSGAADVGAGNATSSVPLSRAVGTALTLVAPYHNNPTVVNGAQRVAVIGSASSGVKSGDPTSLKGKTVAVSLGSTSHNYLTGLLEEAGVSTGDVKLVNVGVPEMPVALQQGTVDAVVPWEPYVSQIIRQAGDKAAVVARGGPYGASVVGIVVTDEFFANNQETLKKYIIGAWKAAQFTRQNPEAAAKIAQRYIRGLNPVDAAAGITFMKSEFDPRISPCTEAAVLQEQQSLIDAGQMKVEKPLPYGSLVKADFIRGLLAEHPELVSDLAALPKTVEECGGRKAAK